MDDDWSVGGRGSLTTAPVGTEGTYSGPKVLSFLFSAPLSSLLRTP